MEHELPRIHVAKLAVNGHTIWFKSCISEPSIEEMKAWAPRCREEALKRGPESLLLSMWKGTNFAHRANRCFSEVRIARLGGVPSRKHAGYGERRVKPQLHEGKLAPYLTFWL
jgi:hypothetical protein